MSKPWENRASKDFLAKKEEIILRIGQDTFSKKTLMMLGCDNFKAARTLHLVLFRFAPSSIRDLAKRITVHDLLEIPAIGQAAVWVWYVVMDSVGIDVELWLNNTPKTINALLHETTKRPELAAPKQQKVA